MTLSLKSLASGSSGNAYLLQAGSTTILIDCGLSARQIATYLRERNIDPRSLDAVLVTHEHSDHIKGLKTLTRRYDVPAFCSKNTYLAVERITGEIPHRHLTTGGTTSIGEVQVLSFAISHDAADPVGFFLEYGGTAICVLTDCGVTSLDMEEHLRNADLIVLEANHDPDVLMNGPYPRFLKTRIRGDKGHLSNEDASRLIVDSANGKPKTVWLAHLSAVNNRPKLAYNTVSGFLKNAGISNVTVKVAERDIPSLFWSASNFGWQPGLI